MAVLGVEGRPDLFPLVCFVLHLSHGLPLTHKAPKFCFESVSSESSRTLAATKLLRLKVGVFGKSYICKITPGHLRADLVVSKTHPLKKLSSFATNFEQIQQKLLGRMGRPHPFGPNKGPNITDSSAVCWIDSVAAHAPRASAGIASVGKLDA